MKEKVGWKEKDGTVRQKMSPVIFMGRTLGYFMNDRRGTSWYYSFSQPITVSLYDRASRFNDRA